jgi:hypothetical protein
MNIQFNINIDDRYVNYFKRLLRSKRARIRLLTLLLGIPLALHAAPVTIPNTFATGGVIYASQVNANFTALKTAVDAHDTRIATLEGTKPGMDVGSVQITNMDLSVTTDLVSVNLTVPAAGMVVVRFDGYAYINVTGDVLLLAASNVSSSWGANDGHTTVTGNAGQQFSFSHTRVYSIGAAGTYTYFACAQRWNGTGLSSIYGMLTAEYFPNRY